MSTNGGLPGEARRAAVVVGVDSSDSARLAAEWAADLAAVWRAPLRLVHAVGDGAAVDVPSWLHELRDAAERVGVEQAEVELASGAAGEALIDRCRGARLLVVGSYGEGSRSGMLAGTTALTLLDRAGCPVAVVRGREPQLPPPRRGPVVVGVDASAAAEPALGLAADLAAASGARLVVVHTWTDVVSDAAGGLHRVPGDTDLARDAVELLDALTERVQDRHPGLSVERRPVEDTAVRGLLDEAASARTVVVGHRGTAAAESRLGSTSRSLAEFAPCPVVVVV
jgi:nucleotide-binding universal stress UspA family protein